jgi:hypothetical protein
MLQKQAQLLVTSKKLAKLCKKSARSIGKQTNTYIAKKKATSSDSAASASYSAKN